MLYSSCWAVLLIRNYFRHCWFRDLNSEWQVCKVFLDNKFTALPHAHQKTVFANHIKERQHKVFQLWKNLCYSVYTGRTWTAFWPQTFMLLFTPASVVCVLRRLPAAFYFTYAFLKTARGKF